LDVDMLVVVSVVVARVEIDGGISFVLPEKVPRICLALEL
jgi:hypothetical protein